MISSSLWAPKRRKISVLEKRAESPETKYKKYLVLGLSQRELATKL